MPELWRVRMLGGLSVEACGLPVDGCGLSAGCSLSASGSLSPADGGQVISRFHTQHAAGALAYLAYYLGQPQPREVLVELLWPGVAPAKGRDRLNVAISSLRRQLEPAEGPRGCVVWGDRHQVMLSPELVTTDVQQFRAAVAEARAATSPEQARPMLSAALELFGGPLLPGHYQSWIGPEQELLNDLLIDAARRLVAIEIAQHRPQAALVVAQRAVLADALREDCHALVLRAAAAMGDAALARRHYEDVVRLFDRELGCKPSAALAELVRAADGVVARPCEEPASVVTEPLIVASGNTTYLGIEGQPRQSVRELAQAYRGSVVSADGAVLAFGAARDAWHCADMLLPEAVTLGLVTLDVADAADAARAIYLARCAAAAGHGQLVLADQSTVALLREAGDGDLQVSEQGRYRLAPGQPPELLHWLSRQARAAAAYPTPRAETAAEAHVPPTLSACFGRDADIAAVDAMLADTPCVVTITGPGGAGKSRLAIEVARLWTRARARTSWFVPLAALRDAALLPRAILGELRGGRRDDTDALGHVVYLLTREPALLVLDNFEQLPDEAAGVLAELAARVPHLCCLVTSRRVLGLAGEREYPLSLLPTPDEPSEPDMARLSHVPSVAMFVDRARLALPTFRLDQHNHRAVAELVARLEGWPLAIELAAPLVQGAPVAALLARFDEHLDWRATRRSSLPERQRTMRATLEWSMSLLPEPARRFLRSLSVFGGAFSLAEAAEVTSEPLAELYIGHLRACSLVERAADAAASAYVLRQPVRELLAGLLGGDELVTLQARHARCFGGLADGCPAAGASSAELGHWLDRVEARLPEVRLALRWGQECDAVWAMELAHALVPFWELRGHGQEGLSWLERLRPAALAAGWQPTGQAALARARLSALLRPCHEVAPLLADAVDRLAATDDQRRLLQALFYQIFNHLLCRNLAGLGQCAVRARELAQAGGPTGAYVIVAAQAAAEALLLGDDQRAIRGLGDAAALSAEAGDFHAQVVHTVHLGLAAAAAEDYDTADRALAVLETGLLDRVDGYWLTRAIWLRVRVALGRGDLPEAARALADASPMVAGQMPTYGHEWALAAAEVLAATGEVSAAAVCVEAGARWFIEQQQPFTLSHHPRVLARLRALFDSSLSAELQQAAALAAGSWSMADLAGQMASLPDLVARTRRAQVS